MAAAQPFAQPFGLGIEARLVGDALAEDASMTKFTARKLGSM